ncbi:MAG: hypothetical protein IPG33_02885 [Betaproteobacteria bacterium]|nr:hypothetical protein [Betaproteobacteria bacterium]
MTIRVHSQESHPMSMDAIIKSYRIKVRNQDSSEAPGRIDCYESGLFVLSVEDRRYVSDSHEHAFDALRVIRLEMEKDGRLPLVNGTNRHALITGMAISMAQGFRVYLIHQLNPPQYSIVVDTFGSDHVTDPVSVAEQDEYRQLFWEAEKNSKSNQELNEGE